MRKIKISLVVFLFAMLSTFTTVYAWLTLANVNRVQDISLNAIVGNDLLISLDGINYYDVIPKELILKELKDLQFDDVTSVDGINFSSHFKVDKTPTPNQEYISLDIYFQTTSRYKELHLSDNLINADYYRPPKEGTYITSLGREFRSQVSYSYSPSETVNEGEVKKHFAKDAMRVSFYNYDDDTTKIFDLSGDEERGFGKPYGAIDYFLKRNQTILNPPEPPKTIYELSTFSEDMPIALTNSSYLITLKDRGNKDINNKTLYEGRIKMNIWLEAWDADAFDAILKDELKMQFMFRAVMLEQELE